MARVSTTDFVDAIRSLWDCWPIVKILIERIDELEEESKRLSSISYADYLFFARENRNQLIDYVKFIYQLEKENNLLEVSAKEIVESFHDETMDLSTLECTGNDFDAWED